MDIVLVLVKIKLRHKPFVAVSALNSKTMSGHEKGRLMQPYASGYLPIITINLDLVLLVVLKDIPQRVEWAGGWQQASWPGQNGVDLIL